MSGLMGTILKTITANLTGTEMAVIALSWAALALLGKWRGWPKGYHRGLDAAASVFLVVYITLLRRAPSYRQQVRWLPVMAGERFSLAMMAGYGMNILLYLPLGMALVRFEWLHKRRQLAVFLCLALSLSCEALQYATMRGMADGMDVLCNWIGAEIGILMMLKMTQRRRHKE